MMDEQERERWREAIAAHEAQTDGTASTDPEVLWSALHGDLPAVEARAAIVEGLNAPHGHEELNLFLEMERELEAPVRLVPRSRLQRAVYWGAGLAAAAAVLVLVTRTPAPTPSDSGTVRAGAQVEVTSPADGATLPRRAFALTWSSVAEGCEYTVRASTAGGEVVVDSAVVTDPAFSLSPGVLDTVSGGSMILWQVDFVCDGVSGQSQTFATTVGQ
jgi:hypothetical protein